MPMEFLPEGIVKRALLKAEKMERAVCFFHFDPVAGADVDVVPAIDGEDHGTAFPVLRRELDDGIVR